MADILAQLQDIVAFAQANQTTEANKIQQLHNFQSDDCVLINTRNMPLSYSAAAPASDTNADSLRGGELRHLAGSPGGGGVIRSCHTLVRVNTV
jgi:hypothetical protein